MLLFNNILINTHSVQQVQRGREKSHEEVQITVRYKDKMNLADDSKYPINITKRSLKKAIPQV